MKKIDLIMKILETTNFQFFLVYENDIFFNLEELIKERGRDRIFSFFLGMRTSRYCNLRKEKNIYFYTLERFDPRVKVWDKTAVLGTVLTLENLFEEFHRERFGDNKYVIEYLNQKERKIND